jgi:hypothetical protein
LIYIHPEVRTYSGNIMGGFLSGESQSQLLKHDRAMHSDPFLGFVLYLYMEAQAEKDLDFAYFRHWNLLETVASERVESGLPVTDFEGRAILRGDGKPFNTRSGARARVYELVKSNMQVRGHTEEFFSAARELPEDLWDVVYVWYAFRNATVHYGGFNPEFAQKLQSWYEVAKDAQQAGSQPGDGGPDPYFGYLERVSAEVVRWELESVSR